MLKRKATTTSTEKAKQSKLASSNSSTSEPWELVMNDGREAVRLREFKRAVQLFSRALELKPNHPTLLEFRAASYEKLGELSLALQDATTMIRNEPQAARGYLRAGKILSLQKKHKSAVNICKRALNNVDPNDNNYQKIKNMMAAAGKILNPPQAHDPLRVLPYDVLSSIFSMLSFERRIQCTSVSRSWRSFALNWPGMWRDLDFSDMKVSFATIKKYLGYAKGRHVRRFTIKNANRNKMEKILKLLIDENCQYIEILEFLGCEIPVTVFLRMLRLVGKHITALNLTMTTIDLNTIITEVLPLCPKLTRLAAVGLISDVVEKAQSYTENERQPFNLTHLRICMNDIDSAKWLLSRCRKLQLLDFSTYRLCFQDLAEEIFTLNTLKDLYFNASSAVDENWPYIMSQHLSEEEQQKVTGLESFHILDDVSFEDTMVRILVQKSYKSLKQLTILNMNEMDEPLSRLVMHTGLPSIEKLEIRSSSEYCLKRIISACPTLQELTLTGTTAVTDSVLEKITSKVKKLKSLNISACPNVTGAGLEKVIKAHKSSMERLDISYCYRISADAISWARSVLGNRAVKGVFKYT